MAQHVRRLAVFGVLSTVRDKFDAAFGEGAGERVGLSCRNVTGEGSVIYEVQMSLASFKVIAPVTDSILAARPRHA